MLGFNPLGSAPIGASPPPAVEVVTPPAATITGITISPKTATGSMVFTKSVSGTGAYSNAATFSKVSGSGSIDPVTGAYVAPAQTNAVQTAVVRVTTADGNWYDEATITIAALVVVPPGSVITGIDASPNTAIIAAGATQQINAVVTGTGSFLNTYSCTILSGAGGSVNGAGLFQGPSADTDRVFSIKVSSDQDPTQFEIITITVLAIPSLPVPPDDLVVAPSRILTTTENGLELEDPSLVNSYKLKNGRYWFINKDPNDILYYGIDLKWILQAAATGIDKVQALVNGVVLKSQAVSHGSVVMALLDGGDPDQFGDLISDYNHLTFRVTCTNGEQFDASIYFSIVDS